MSEMNRRDFLKLVASYLLTASGALGLAGLLRFMSHPTHPASPTQFDLGSTKNYPPGSRAIVANGTALLTHTEDGFHALSLVCTHLACTVTSQKVGFTCPCHHSLFANDGSVERGPAQKPLRILRIETDTDGHLILFTEP